MASVSPSSSVSRVAVEDRVGLEFPQAPSSIFGDAFASVDVGVKARVTEAYYLALAKYYEAVTVVPSADVYQNGSVASELQSATSVSVASSARSRRRRRRRVVESSARRAAVDMVQVEQIPGLSYLVLVSPAHRYDIRVELGRSPTLGQLLKCPSDWFLTGLAMIDIMCRVGDGVIEFGLGGDRHAVDVLSQVAYVYRTERGSFGSTIRGLDGGDHGLDRLSVVGSVVPVVRGLALDGAVDSGLVGALDMVVSKLPTGYCYSLILAGASTDSSARQLIGPNPSVASVLRSPLEFFSVDRLNVGVDCSLDGTMHMHSTGAYGFGQVAATVIQRSGDGLYLPLGSLGHYVAVHYEPIVGLHVSKDCVLGALPADVQLMLGVLSRLSGLSVDAFDHADAGLVVKTAAFHDAPAKTRLRMLEAVGDNALSMVVAQRCLGEGLSVQDYQTARSLLTSNVHLAGLFVKTGLVSNVQFAAGVPRDGKVGAGCFEAMLALVYGAGSMSSVLQLCTNASFFSAYEPWAGVG